MKSFIGIFFIVCIALVFVFLSKPDLYTGCEGCHGTDGSKIPMAGVAPLKGQSKDEILVKLKGYKEGAYGGVKKKMMMGQVQKLSLDDLEKLADKISKF